MSHTHLPSASNPLKSSCIPADSLSIMERREAERFKVQFEAKVTAASQKLSALARVSDLSNSGMSVGLPFQLTAGDAVEIQMADSALQGRVIYSRPDNSLFRTGIEVDQITLGTTGLASLLRRVLLENLSEVPGLETEPAGSPLA